MKKLLATLLLTAAFLGNAVFVHAAEKERAQAAEKEKKARGIPFNGKVSAVDKAAMTITLEGKEKPRVFQLSAAAKISRDKQAATLDDIKVGERVGGYARENAEGKLEVVTLNVGLPPRAGKAKEGEDK